MENGSAAASILSARRRGAPGPWRYPARCAAAATVQHVAPRREPPLTALLATAINPAPVNKSASAARCGAYKPAQHPEFTNKTKSREYYLKLLCRLLNAGFAGLATYALISAAIAAYPKPSGPHHEFEQALEDYKSGHTTAAYGRFMRLADAGDAEAARIALVLLRHGPEMHGTAWGASQPQIDHWIALAQKPMPRIIAESGD